MKAYLRRVAINSWIFCSEDPGALFTTAPEKQSTVSKDMDKNVIDMALSLSKLFYHWAQNDFQKVRKFSQS